MGFLFSCAEFRLNRPWLWWLSKSRFQKFLLMMFTHQLTVWFKIEIGLSLFVWPRYWKSIIFAAERKIYFRQNFAILYFTMYVLWRLKIRNSKSKNIARVENIKALDITELLMRLLLIKLFVSCHVIRCKMNNLSWKGNFAKSQL